MKLEHMVQNLEKRGVEYALGQPASDIQVAQAEERLNLKFPEQIRLFYEHYNGLSVKDPPLEVLELNQLNFISPHFLHFATFDHQHQVCFDISHLNDAEQWFIVSATDGYRITFTTASFWSNKIWHWISLRRTVWTNWKP
jgi:cell wall assembly regulator SMI1